MVDNTMVALGGNMRFRALSAIQGMEAQEIAERLSASRDFQKKTEAEKNQLLEYWEAWKDNATTPVIRASELTDEEQREFIIKDNVGYGEWDMDALANEWDNEDLVDWGLDVGTRTTVGTRTDRGRTPNSEPANASLNERFIVRFSQFSTPERYWQARKKNMERENWDMERAVMIPSFHRFKSNTKLTKDKRTP